MPQSAAELPGLQYGVKLNNSSDAGFARIEILFSNGHRAEPQDIWKARRFIDQHLTEDISLTKVANAVGINSTHLSEKFKQVTGIKFVDYVARNRFERALTLLDDFDLRVSEIAFEVGFQSLSQFNRVFKRFSGKSPSGYRATHSKPRNVN